MSRRTDTDVIQGGIDMLRPVIQKAERSRVAADVVHWLIDNGHQSLVVPISRVINQR